MIQFLALLKQSHCVQIQDTLFTKWHLSEFTNEPENEVIYFQGHGDNNEPVSDILTEEDLNTGRFSPEGKFILPDGEELTFYGSHQLYPANYEVKGATCPKIISALSDHEIANIMQIPNYSAHPAEITLVNYGRDVANAAAQRAIDNYPDILHAS